MILDTFISYFTADTKDLEDGYDKVSKSTDKVEKGLEGVEQKVTDTTRELKKTEQQANKTSKGLSEMAQNGSDGLTAMVKKITAVLGGLAVVGKSISGAVDRSKEIEEAQTLLDISEEASKLNKKDAMALIAKAGLDKDQTEAALKGRLAMEALLKSQKHQGLVSKESANNAKEFNERLLKLKEGMSTASNAVLDKLIPVFSFLLEIGGSVVDWVKENQQFLIIFLTGLSAVLVAVFFPAIMTAAAGLWAFITPLLIAAAPFIAIAAGVALLALAIDDLISYFQGGESALGKLVDKFPALGKAIDVVVSYYKGLWSIVVSVFEGIMSYLKTVKDFWTEVFTIIGDVIQIFAKVFMNLTEGIRESIAELYGVVKDYLLDKVGGAFNTVGDVVTGVMDSIKNAISIAASFIADKFKIISNTLGKIKGFIGSVKSAVGITDDVNEQSGGDDQTITTELNKVAKARIEVQQNVNQVDTQLKGANANQLNSATQASIQSSNTRNVEQNVSVGQVTISTQATDSKGIASDMGSELQKELERVTSELQTGVDR